MKKTIRVTFESRVKIGKETKIFINVEDHASEADARLRALALHWTIVKIEKLGA